MKKIGYFSLVVCLSILPYMVKAAPQDSGPGVSNPGAGGSDGLSYKLKNPLGFDTLQEFIVALINVFVIIATPIIVLFIIFAGFKYVTARGEPAKIKQATEALTYAVIGGVLILGAKAIAMIIGDLVTSFGA